MLTHEKIMDGQFQAEVERYVHEQVLEQVNEVVNFAIKHDESVWDSIENLYYTEKDCTEDGETEGDMREVFTWYLVDERLWKRLKERGEVVAEILGLSIWGRCTFGQAISMDREIMEIYDGLEYKGRYQR